MAAISNQSSWRDRALERAEIITDSWEVTKSYAGRLAEWILFLCMIFCIVEILPGVTFPTWASNVVLGIQAVMLDIGGFALSSMADHARANGDERAARKADKTGKFLIGIVILTLALITVGLLYPPAKQYTDGAEKVLILVRVVMTVVYGHVIHSLRRQSATLAIQPMQQANDDVIQGLRDEVAQLRTDVATQWSAETQLLQAQLEVIAALLSTQSAQQIEVEESNTPVNNDAQIVDIKDYRNEQQFAQQLVNSQRAKITRKLSTRIASRSATKSAPNAKQKALKVLKRNPEISAPELSTKAGISRQYASKILAELKA